MLSLKPLPKYLTSRNFYVYVVSTLVFSIFMNFAIHGLGFEGEYVSGDIATSSVRATRDVIVKLNEDGGAENIYYEVKRGEIIVRAGDRISKDQLAKLMILREHSPTSQPLRTWGGYFILTGLVFLTVVSFFSRSFREFRPDTVDLILLSTVLFLSLLSLQVFSVIGASLEQTLSNFSNDTVMLAAPLAAGGMIIQSVLGSAAVSIFVLSFALLTGVFLDSSWLFLAIIVVGNMVSATGVLNSSKRSGFLRSALRVSAVNVVLVLAFLLLGGDFEASGKAYRIICAVIGGVLSGVVAVAMIPVVEFFGKYTTDMKLFELSSLDQPLLRELSLQAPGTWNHSTVVGQMGEVAAKAINANSLLVRVGAYYHDVGKSKYPAYFIENQGSENRHDKLTPSMSALIIKAHVKDGIELAEEAKLPEAIIKMIREHHGTSVIEYFYEKAKRECEEGEVVEDSGFRYSGPKPQSKESAILMIADTIEASSRALADPSPAKIQGLVQKMINKIFTSGELAESGLTLRDLHLMAKSFVRVLNGIYHRRVEYPEASEKAAREKKRIETEGQRSDSERAKHGKQGEGSQKQNNPRSSDKEQSQKGTRSEPTDKGVKEDTSNSLKRLGI